MPLTGPTDDPISLRAEAVRFLELAADSNNERVCLALETMAGEMEVRAADIEASLLLRRVGSEVR